MNSWGHRVSRYADFVCACRWAFTFAHRALCAAAILFRAARLILRNGLDALACLAVAHRARWATAILARVVAENVRRFRATLGGRPTLGRPVELTASSAEIAWSMRPRSPRSSARILLVSMMAPRARILTAHVLDWQRRFYMVGCGTLWTSRWRFTLFNSEIHRLQKDNRSRSPEQSS